VCERERERQRETERDRERQRESVLVRVVQRTKGSPLCSNDCR